MTDVDVVMSNNEASSSSTTHRLPTIQSGNNVLLRLPNGDIRGVKVDKDAYSDPFLLPPPK